MIFVLCCCDIKLEQNSDNTNRSDDLDSFNWIPSQNLIIELRSVGELTTDSDYIEMRSPEFIDSNNETIYIYDSDLGEVFMFDNDLNFTGVLLGESNRIDDYIHDMDVYNNTIVLAGTRQIYIYDSELRSFANVYSIQSCAVGNNVLYAINMPSILEPSDLLINEFTLDGRFVRSFGDYDFEDSALDQSKHRIMIEFDNENITLANTYFPQVTLISEENGNYVQDNIYINEDALITRSQNNLESLATLRNVGRARFYRVFASLNVLDEDIFMLVPNMNNTLIARIEMNGTINSILRINRDNNPILDIDTLVQKISENVRILIIIAEDEMEQKIIIYEALID